MTDPGIALLPSGEPGPVRSRRRRAAAAVAVAAVLGAATTVAVTTPWTDDDPADAPAPGPVTEERADASDADGDLALPERRFVLDPVPDGLVANHVQDPALRPDDFGFAAGGTSVLLAAPDATYADGPWLTVSTTDLSDMGGGPFDPADSFPGGTSRPITIGTYPGAIGEGFSGDPLLQFGPAGSDEHLVVALQARGLTQNDLVEIASGLALGDDDRPRLDSDTLPVSMEVVASSDRSVGTDPIGFLFDYRRLVVVSYGSADPVASFDGTGQSITVTVRAAEGDDPLGDSRFFLADVENTTVNGNPGVVGSAEAFTGFGNATVVWVDGAEVISLTVGDELDAAALAETVRPAEGDDWSELASDVAEFQVGAQEAQRLASRTWLIDAGELEDATTWVAEGNFSDAGTFFTSVAEFGSDGSSSSSGGGFGSADPTQIPNVMTVNAGSHSSIAFALAPLDQIGALLRITFDDGTSSERELHVVRPEWPALAAAVGFEATASGRVELIGSDGTVLADDRLASGLDGGSSDGRFGSADTVAAASG